MAKYDFAFNIQVVRKYISGAGGYEYLGKKHQLNKSIIRRWIVNYKRYGEEGLKRNRQKQTYPFEFKLHVVELYLTSELSCQQLTFKVGMTDPSTIARWVNEYRAASPEALKPRKKGRKQTMDKDRIGQEIKTNGSDEQKELLKQLKEENLNLRIENAFLKEVRRLRLEEEGLQKKQRESSTASGESSN